LTCAWIGGLAERQLRSPSSPSQSTTLAELVVVTAALYPLPFWTAIVRSRESARVAHYTMYLPITGPRGTWRLARCNGTHGCWYTCAPLRNKNSTIEEQRLTSAPTPQDAGLMTQSACDNPLLLSPSFHPAFPPALAVYARSDLGGEYCTDSRPRGQPRGLPGSILMG
jgi:hypothetical protein